MTKRQKLLEIAEQAATRRDWPFYVCMAMREDEALLKWFVSRFKPTAKEAERFKMCGIAWLATASATDNEDNDFRALILCMAAAVAA